MPVDTFTVLTGTEGQPWLDAAGSLTTKLGFVAAAVAIGVGLKYSDIYGEWTNLREIAGGGCVVVRPDKYVAWRSDDVTSNPLDDLRAVLESALGRTD